MLDTGSSAGLDTQMENPRGVLQAILANRPAPSNSSFFGVTIFLGAFLLFQVQLIIGKYILPWFGGTPSVWTACMVVFQSLLLAGYAYAHVLSQQLNRKAQAIVHVSLVLVSVTLMAWLATRWNSPITSGANWKPAAEEQPTWQIVHFLLASVATPFFLLSTTGPLVQHWFAQVKPGRSPYRLYALSNLGSLLGLITYPFLVEPHFALRKQAWLWSGSYLAYAMACLICALWAGRTSSGVLGSKPIVPHERSNWSSRFLWSGLATCGSAMLLATTNMICQQVAVIPFLWVVPLCLYLLSFILCFENARWYRRSVFHPLYFLSAMGACVLLLQRPDASVLLQLIAYPALLFISCMVCHGELAKLKPAPEHLTEFYLWIAAGGVLGGLYVSVIAPSIFADFWEFHTAILMAGVLLLITARRDVSSWWAASAAWVTWAVVSTVAIFSGVLVRILNLEHEGPLSYGLWAVAGLAAVGLIATRFVPQLQAMNPRVTRLASFAALVALAVGFLADANTKSLAVLKRSRNFYGIVAVVRENSTLGPFLYLRNQMTNHGMQFLQPRLANEPAGYSGPESGIGLLMQSHARPVCVGLVGLGVGTLAAYGRAGDSFRFYEINPAVVDVSYGPNAFFTYLRNTGAATTIVLGDARISLEREAAHGEFKKFDILILDAFSGDAIPVHLLTKEAFETYLKHMRSEDSIIAVHISNVLLDLSQIVAGLAREYGLTAIRVHRPSHHTFSSQMDWILMSRNPEALNYPAILEAGTKLVYEGRVPLWTDDYSNLFFTIKSRMANAHETFH